MSNYLRLALMVATSVVLMYGITYLQSAEIVDHAYLSESRAFVSLMMGAVMTVVMLLWMPGMYSNRSANIAIILGCAVAFGGLLYLMRSQDTVGDVAWMRAMIPHHSIAILTSGNAELSDPRVQDLAQEIIDAQVREIDEMKALIADLTGASSQTAAVQ
ncbi:DUF305 domain-containing protein [Psychromarinibacter halotolerans]|uniref:DUF305 domain-containing protein n=1 Tax=Psychromarinibacter halotolerans TaxID=1775175 RepID=A0ABV7GSS6_9RHOB|nr:DUF305 domain-containing protein [Psychromarinibacter halotolerans]MDF0594764.1 DUF305 domain-containing protein [Psychromarinibacter halotolerans]